MKSIDSHVVLLPCMFVLTDFFLTPVVAILFGELGTHIYWERLMKLNLNVVKMHLLVNLLLTKLLYCITDSQKGSL